MSGEELIEGRGEVCHDAEVEGEGSERWTEAVTLKLEKYRWSRQQRHRARLVDSTAFIGRGRCLNNYLTNSLHFENA